jgi:glycosyltransferase involved in cell wall biosynthesis
VAALRVLFATDHVHFPQGGGGAERNTHELCLGLLRHGVVPAVVASLVPDASLMSWRNRIRRQLPPRRRFPVDHVCGYATYRGWQEDPSREVTLRFRPDVVVVQSTQPTPLLDGFRAAGIPCAAYFHEVEEIDHLSALTSRDVRILANSPFTARRLHERCGLNADVVLPIIDPDLYRTTTTRERVLFVNTVPRKGLEIAFALAQHRRDVGFDFVLSWILSPAQRDALVARAAALGNVALHPPTRDMRQFYRTARIVLMPSQWEETWGRIATEAHVNGIPVLGSDRGGLPDAIGPGGSVVPATAAVAEWAASFDRMWDDRAEYDTLSRAATLYSQRAAADRDRISEDLIGLLRREISAGQGYARHSAPCSQSTSAGVVR